MAGALNGRGPLMAASRPVTKFTGTNFDRIRRVCRFLGVGSINAMSVDGLGVRTQHSQYTRTYIP